jgi:hypothetical protein
VVERRVFGIGKGGLILDDRWFPVVIGTWWGELSPELIVSYFGWYDGQLARARSEGTKISLITDGLDVQRPSGEARKSLAIESQVREAANRELVVSTYVVVHGALLLGVLASVMSVFRGGLRISSTSDMVTALERTLARFDQAGLPRPAGLDPATYVRPSRTEG